MRFVLISWISWLIVDTKLTDIIDKWLTDYLWMHDQSVSIVDKHSIIMSEIQKGYN